MGPTMIFPIYHQHKTLPLLFCVFRTDQ
uniref:Uncharacterized protein n=1 Tax=Lepeophtheirus salmonis TaxID=72036 RepID=A0A0K2UVA0_LEPSM